MQHKVQMWFQRFRSKEYKLGSVKNNYKSVVGLLLSVVLLLFSLVLIPQAEAKSSSSSSKSFSINATRISAIVNTDGSMKITQTRNFTFNGFYQVQYLKLGEIVSSDVEVTNVALNGRDLPNTAFQTPWRTTGNPSKECWSYDSAEATIYCFSGNKKFASNSTITYEYTIKNVINRYADCGELYWKFIGEFWEVSNNNVTCTITLPEGSSNNFDTQVWQHGPIMGSITKNGNTVTYKNPVVSKGDLAEIRIIFSPEALSDLPQSSQPKLQEIERQENAYKIFAPLMKILRYALVLLPTIICLILYLIFGREPKPKFQDKYWRDYPEPGINPAVLYKIMNFGEGSTKGEDLSSAIMFLSNKGVLDLVPEQNNAGTIQYKFIIKENSVYDPNLDNVDRATIEFLTHMGGGNQFYYSHFKAKMQDYPVIFKNHYDTWKEAVDDEIRRGRYFNQTSKTAAKVYGLICSGIIVCYLIASSFGLLPSFLSNYLVTGLIILQGCLIPIFSTKAITKRTQKGAEIAAKGKGLKNWLCDFTALKERPPADVKVWGIFMSYAFALGVSKKAINQLKIYAPEMFTNNSTWYIWYSPVNVNGFNFDFGSSFSSSMTASFSSIGGSVGGFGGGGFGGGGGGGAR